MRKAAPLNSTKKPTKTARSTIRPTSRSAASSAICKPSARTTSFAELEYPKCIESLVIDNTKITSFIGAKQLSTLLSFSCKNTALEQEKYLDIMCLIAFGPQLKKINGTLISERRKNIATKYSNMLLPFLSEGYLLYSLRPDVQICTKTEGTTYVYPITEDDVQEFVEKNNEIAQNEEELKTLREKLADLQQELDITLDPRKAVKPQILRSSLRRRKSCSSKSSVIDLNSGAENTVTEKEDSNEEQTINDIKTEQKEVMEEKAEETLDVPTSIDVKEEPLQEKEEAEKNEEEVKQSEEEVKQSEEEVEQKAEEIEQKAEEIEQKEEEEQDEDELSVHYAPIHAAAESAYANHGQSDSFNPVTDPFPEGRTVRTPVFAHDNSDSQEILDMLYKSGSDDDEDLYPPM